MKNKDLENKKIFAIRKALFNKAIYAGAVFAILVLSLGILSFFYIESYYSIPISLIGLIQIIVLSKVFFTLNYGYANNQTINKYRKIWLFLLLTLNLLGCIYILLLVKKI